MRKMLLRVQKIRFQSEKSNYKVFLADVYEVSKKTGQKKQTREKITCTGQFVSLFVGDFLTVEAEKADHPTYGEQYEVSSFHREEPGTIEEIQKFLMSRGKGLGIVKARAITDRYGLDTLQKIAQDPTALDPFSLPDKTKQSVREEILNNGEFEKLLMFFQIHHIDNLYSNLIYKKYGEDSIEHLTDNPYAPFIDGIWNFQESERLHASLGYPYNTKMRLVYGLLAAIRWDSEYGGNLFIPEDMVEEAAATFFLYCKSPYSAKAMFTAEEIEAGLAELENMRLILVDRTSKPSCIYLDYNQYHEEKIALGVRRLTYEFKRILFQKADIEAFLTQYEQKYHVALATKQKEAVITSLISPISIITGGPGTGKTYTINLILACIKALAPKAITKVCAPTGRAAIRAEELSGISASTIHRMLRLYHPQGELGPEELDCDILFVDEMSMTDAFLCNKLFTAVSSNARVIMVGDHHQLPSVGPGLVLRDFIQSGKIAVTKLDMVFRQKGTSLIVSNAHNIIHTDSHVVPVLEFSQNPDGDFRLIEAEDWRDIRFQIQDVVQDLKTRLHYGINDIQILSPVKQTALGTESLNILFQEAYLPAATTPCLTFEDKEFRLGDKVVHTKNNNQWNVFNGEIGTVTSLNFQSDHMLTVSYPNNKDVLYSISMLEELSLAYALTVHKSQGSEFPVVIIPVHESILYGFNRAVLFTALTRAKKKVILIGSKRTLHKAFINDINVGDRRSKLIEKIQKNMIP